MFSRQAARASRLCPRCYSTSTGAPAAPPMLLKIRKDMKAAMIAKDTNRLNVLRAVLTQTLNASKTNSPITTDMQMLALLRKTASASRAASDEFKSAGRQDLADKENAQISVLDEYAGGVEVIGAGEIEDTVRDLVETMKKEGAKMQMGDVLKRVFSPEVFGGKPVERAEVAKVVKQVLG